MGLKNQGILEGLSKIRNPVGEGFNQIGIQTGGRRASRNFEGTGG